MNARCISPESDLVAQQLTQFQYPQFKGISERALQRNDWALLRELWFADDPQVVHHALYSVSAFTLCDFKVHLGVRRWLQTT